MESTYTLADYDACVPICPHKMPAVAACQPDPVCLPTLSPKTRPQHTRSQTQLTDVAETLYQTLMTEKLKPLERAGLARALCDVDKRIRAWKGLPEPGQLRPDVLPMKRGKVGKVIEIEQPTETPDPDAPTTARVLPTGFGKRKQPTPTAKTPTTAGVDVTTNLDAVTEQSDEKERLPLDSIPTDPP